MKRLVALAGSGLGLALALGGPGTRPAQAQGAVPANAGETRGLASAKKLLASARKADWKAVGALFDPKKPARDCTAFVRWARIQGKAWWQKASVIGVQTESGSVWIHLEAAVDPGITQTAVYSPRSGKFVDYIDEAGWD